VFSAFCATKPLSTVVGQRSLVPRPHLTERCGLGTTRDNNGLQQWDYNGCTVRFVYRIFEYSFVLGIFDLLGFRVFVLALLNQKTKEEEGDKGIPPTGLLKC